MKRFLYGALKATVRFFHRLLENEIMRRRPGLRKEEYSLRWPHFQVTHSPWDTAAFVDIYRPIQDRTLVKQESCYYVHYFSLNCGHLPGDFAEAGVYRGGTAYLIANNLRQTGIRGRKFHLFDTFVGMPESADSDPSNLSEGDFGDTSLAEVKEFLGNFKFVAYHQGRIPATFSKLKKNRFSFVHIDVDLYDSTVDCLDFFYRRMVRGGIIIFDNYGYPNFVASERQAADEFFLDLPENPIVLPTGQAFVIKT